MLAWVGEQGRGLAVGVSGRTAFALALNLIEPTRVVGSDDAALDGLRDREVLLLELVESVVHAAAQRLRLVLVQAVVDAFTCDRTCDLG